MQRRKTGNGVAQVFKVQAPTTISHHRSSRSQGNGFRLRKAITITVFSVSSSTDFGLLQDRERSATEQHHHLIQVFNFCAIRSRFHLVYRFFILCLFGLWCSGSESRSRSGTRKSVAERYRNCRANWLLSKKSAGNWRERFEEFYNSCDVEVFSFLN